MDPIPYHPVLRKLKLRWSCSDYVKHSHRWYWTAWLCGQWQRFKLFLRVFTGSSQQ